MRDGRAVGRVALAAVHERMLVELVSHGLADRSGCTAVDDAHRRKTGEGRIVHEEAFAQAEVNTPLSSLWASGALGGMPLL